LDDNSEIQFSLKGNRKNEEVYRWDSVSHKSYKGKKHIAISRKCLDIIQAESNAEKLKLTTCTNRLKSSATIINVK